MAREPAWRLQEPATITLRFIGPSRKVRWCRHGELDPTASGREVIPKTKSEGKAETFLVSDGVASSVFAAS
jgi:hypothetical protein